MKKASWIRNQVPIYRRKKGRNKKKKNKKCFVEARKSIKYCRSSKQGHLSCCRKAHLRVDQDFPQRQTHFQKAIICLNSDNHREKKSSQRRRKNCAIFFSHFALCSFSVVRCEKESWWMKKECESPGDCLRLRKKMEFVWNIRALRCVSRGKWRKVFAPNVPCRSINHWGLPSVDISLSLNFSRPNFKYFSRSHFHTAYK